MRVFEFLQYLGDLKAPPKEGEEEQRPAKWSVSRLHIAVDGGSFTPRDCYEAFLRGDIRCDASRKSHKWLSSADGDTLYLGSRASGRLVRIYNRRGPTRVEIESKGKWARLLGDCLSAEGSADFERLAISYVRQFVDFVDSRASSGSISRAPLLPWWQAFVGDVSKAQLKPDKGEFASSALSKAQAYLERFKSTLCVIRNGLGISLDQVCDSSEGSLTPKHLQRIEEIRRALEGRCS